jgi:hypothetical protein
MSYESLKLLQKIKFSPLLTDEEHEEGLKRMRKIEDDKIKTLIASRTMRLD